VWDPVEVVDAGSLTSVWTALNCGGTCRGGGTQRQHMRVGLGRSEAACKRPVGGGRIKITSQASTQCTPKTYMFF
jgi:hypothetical protein